MANIPAAQLSKEQSDELLCTYAALILHDDGAEINPSAMNNLIKAAGCSVEGYWPTLFSKMISTQGIESLLAAGGGGGGGVAVAAASGGAVGGGSGDAPAAKKEEKKVEEEEEEEGMDFDLFG
uniref:Ribosomal protein P1 n=1 Tax=Karlodinium veneficum TaxID=407301 RepID=F8QQI5_KARVE|nr:ribosomal protein P1 [Karlodinium veneficum]